MARDGIECDDSRWPIVIYRTIGIPADEQVDRFIASAELYLARREPYVVVFDNTLSGRPTAYMRKRAGDWLAANASELAKHCLGTGLVFRSAALRFVMSTVMLVVNHPVDHEVFGTADEAIAWGEDLLATLRRTG